MKNASEQHQLGDGRVCDEIFQLRAMKMNERMCVGGGLGRKFYRVELKCVSNMLFHECGRLMKCLMGINSLERQSFERFTLR